MKNILLGLFLGAISLGCRKSAPEGAEATKQSVEIVAPGANEVQLVRDFMAKTLYVPTADEIKEQSIEKVCLDIKTTPVVILSVKGKYAILKSQQVVKTPGLISCGNVHVVLENHQSKWQIRTFTGRYGSPRLVDINNDGNADILFFSQAEAGRVVEAAYMGDKEGKLTAISDPALDKCYSSTGPVHHSQYLDLKPCEVIIDCEMDDHKKIKYDCGLKRFVGL